jgi:hypothetical protein
MITPQGDTDAETARVHEAMLRAATPERRLALALSLSRSVLELSRQGLRRSLGAAATDLDAAIRFVELHYGAELARGVRRRLSEIS